MEEATIIGVDLAKNVFQLHGARAGGSVAFRKKLSRLQFHKFMAGLAPCVVVMEACGRAHHWAREMIRLGHDAKLIAPRYVKPFVKRHKNDANDTEAIVEAATRPTMCFVEVKTEAQQERAIVFRACVQLINQRTELVNTLRAHPLARGDGGGVPDDGDRTAVTAGLHPEDAEPRVRAVEGQALDEAGDDLAAGSLSRRAHRPIRG